ncbi:MAG: sigma-70 family RNA polymerase sigma factor [Bacteroidota bacterium]
MPPALDTDVLTRYVDQNRAALLGFIRSKVGDDALAEDVLQDSLLKALRAAPEIDDEESLETWLYRVVRNAITDSYRRHAAAARRLERYAREQPDPVDWPDHPSEAEGAALCGCFRGLLPALKPEYAEALEAVDLGDEPAEAAAERLGISTANLRVRRHRARQQLREGLEATCGACAEHGCVDCSCRP